jgi:N-acetyl-alpha-D-muramate 1-phosphate uridylyltransferase
MTMPDHAMVLAAGLGLRMRPLTKQTPKPLIPVAGRSMLDHVFDRLDEAGVPNRVVNTHWLADEIARHLANHSGVILSHEDVLLGTGGGVANALPLLGAQPFFVCNADVIWLDGARPALIRLAEVWDTARMDALLLLEPVGRAFGYDGAGDFFRADDGRLQRRGDASTAPLVFTGVQILHPRLFADAPDGEFSLNILYDRAQATRRLFGLVHEGDWLHIGTPETLTAAESWFAARGPGPLADRR